MSDLPVEAMPALLHHSIRIYDAMLNASSKREGKVIYIGYITRLVTGDLKIPSPTMSHSMNLLKDMNCVRQLKRGGGGTPSSWLMIERPTEEIYLRVKDPLKAPPREDRQTPGKNYDSEIKRLQEQVRILEDENRKKSNILHDLGSNFSTLNAKYEQLLRTSMATQKALEGLGVTQDSKELNLEL